MSVLSRSDGSYGDFRIASLLHTISDVDFDFDSLANALDCTRDLYGTGIIYSEDQRKYVVRPPSNTQSAAYIVVTKVPYVSRAIAEKELKETVASPSLSKEIISAALSCGGVLLNIGAAILGTGAIPFTAGASSAMVAVAGTVATAAQCGLGVIRIIDITKNDGEITTWFDSQQWYLTTSSILDVISIASAGAALKEVLITYRTMKAASSLKTSQWLKNLPRQERARITTEIIRNRNTGISNNSFKIFIKAGKYPKRFPSDAIQKSLQAQLVNSLNSMTAFSGSAISGVINSPSSLIDSGEYVVGIIQSIEIFQ